MTKKKLDAATVVVGFMLADHVEGEGDLAVHFTADQRVELTKKDFTKWEKAGLVEKGKRVEMLTGVEGGRFSLKAHDKPWLPTRIADAWKDEGMCVPAQGDASFEESIKVHQETATNALNERDEALRNIAVLEASISEQALVTAALEAQVHSFAASTGELFTDTTAKELKAPAAEFAKLVGMLPDLPDDAQLDLDGKSGGEA